MDGGGAGRCRSRYEPRTQKLESYVTFGFVSDAFGRKRAYVTYLLAAAALILAYAWTRNAMA